MPLIENGKFLEGAGPSFAYGSRGRFPLTLLLNYSNIDIQGNLTFRQGVHRLSIESNVTAGRKILIIQEDFS